MRIFVDENLSPTLVAVCNQAGLDATCSRDRGMLGRPDHDVLAFAIAEDAVIVTINADDFRALCAAEDAHPGLIVLAETARAQTEILFANALQHIKARAAQEGVEPRDFMFNRAVEVELDGTCFDYQIPTTAR